MRAPLEVNMRLIWLAVAAVLPLCACSDVGFGLAGHPGDCAMGIAWADCAPGTAGYKPTPAQLTYQARESGVPTPQEVQEQFKAQNQEAQAECAREMQAPDFDAIRMKIELFRADAETPPPFAIASNDTFPATADRPVIAKWATARDNCIKRLDAMKPPASNALEAAFIQQDRSFAIEAAGRLSELIVALYQGKLTYGEFAQKRYQIGRDAAAAERQFRAAALIADHERQVQEQQLAQQQFQNNLIAWSSYMQAVNARQPYTVHLDCMSNRMGTFVSTHCN
jgi:hypothetical protein